MKLRTQLVIVFLLLAILPLAGIVLYSYYSSQRSFRQAVEKETAALAAQMDTRMDGIQEELGRRIERIGELGPDALVAASDPEADDWTADASFALAAELGDSADLLDRLEWFPGTTLEVDWPDAEFVSETTDLGETEFKITTGDSEVEDGEMTIRIGGSVSGDGVIAPVPPAPPTAHVPPVPSLAPFAPIVIEIPRIEVIDGVATVVGIRSQTFVDPEAVSEVIKRKFEESARTRELFEAAAELQREGRRERKAHANALEERIEERNERYALRELRTIVHHEGSDVGVLKASLREDAIVRKVLLGTAPESDDVAYAVNSEGIVMTARQEDKERLAGISLASLRTGASSKSGDWVLATTTDQESGLTFGIARPVRGSLRQMRATAMNNFVWGLGLLGIALIFIIPIANHLTRDIAEVMEGVDRISHGDLETPVSIKSKNEIGRLATAFNRMAGDLKKNQQQLIDEERKRQEQELDQRVLEAEYARKSSELEEARRFQLSLLPRNPPTHPQLDIAVFVKTATEVGGDYYDYHEEADGSLTIAIGDATGHGARAGTMASEEKSLFAGKEASTSPSEFLDAANKTLRRMGLERMAMAFTVAHLTGESIELASAGMPPALVFRAASGEVEELVFEAPPLGALQTTYSSRRAALSSGDVVLMMTDGFPELADQDGEILGYTAAEDLFRQAGRESSSDVVAKLAAAADEWTNGEPPSDDITFLAIRVG